MLLSLLLLLLSDTVVGLMKRALFGMCVCVFLLGTVRQQNLGVYKAQSDMLRRYYISCFMPLSNATTTTTGKDGGWWLSSC